jgi:hypothetical protein
MKLKLNLDDLRVDTFGTTAPAGAKGTVIGQQQCSCYTCTCPGCPTCVDTCQQTCGTTCPFTCADGTCGGIYDTTCNCTVNGYSCAGTC